MFFRNSTPLPSTCPVPRQISDTPIIYENVSLPNISAQGGSARHRLCTITPRLCPDRSAPFQEGTPCSSPSSLAECTAAPRWSNSPHPPPRANNRLNVNRARLLMEALEDRTVPT